MQHCASEWTQNKPSHTADRRSRARHIDKKHNDYIETESETKHFFITAFPQYIPNLSTALHCMITFWQHNINGSKINNEILIQHIPLERTTDILVYITVN